MPTGYTAPVQSGKITEFKEFALLCARGMGATINMRDLPFDTPIPERFEPELEYHDTSIRRAQERFKELHTLSMEELQTQANANNVAERQRREEYAGRKAEYTDRYLAMIDMVEEWEPPTEDHMGLKKFMLEQLNSSIEVDCDMNYEPEPLPENINVMLWFAQELEKVGRDIAYHTKARREEIERTEKRNVWLAQLRASL